MDSCWAMNAFLMGKIEFLLGKNGFLLGKNEILQGKNGLLLRNDEFALSKLARIDSC